MRTIGIDLAVKAAHKAVVVEANGQFVTPVLSFHSRSFQLRKTRPAHSTIHIVTAFWSFTKILFPATIGCAYVEVSETLIRANCSYCSAVGLKAASSELLGRARRHEPASTIAAKPRPRWVVSVQAVWPFSALMQ